MTMIKMTTSPIQVMGGKRNKGKTAAIPSELMREGFLYVRTRAISARTNRNFDTWPSVELKKAHQTFLGKPVFVNHENYDHTRTRGKIVSSEYIEKGDDKYIELVIEVDAKNFPKLAEKIMSGELDSVSMGASVGSTRCSYCDHSAETAYDFCEHVANHRGEYLHNDKGERVLVSEICEKVSFFEISFVFDPADETAVHQEVIMSKEADYPIVSPPDVDTLREEMPCPQCGNESFNGHECKVCQWSETIDQFSDPDTDKATDSEVEELKDEDDNEDDEDDDKDDDKDKDKESRIVSVYYLSLRP